MEYQEDKDYPNAHSANHPDLDAAPADWDSSPVRDSRTVGNKTLSIPDSEHSTETSALTPESTPIHSELGQIIDLEMPPNASPIPASASTSNFHQEATASAPDHTPAYQELASIREHVNKTSKITGPEVRAIESIINQSGDIADINDAIRGAE